MNILEGIPRELCYGICSALNVKDSDNLCLVSKQMNAIVKNLVLPAKKTQFNDIFGSLSQHEGVSYGAITILANKLHSIRQLKPSTQDTVLTFVNGKFLLVPLVNENDTSLQIFKNKYHVFRDKPQTGVAEEIINLFKTHCELIKELDSRVDSEQTAQDMRDKILRVEGVFEERKILNEVLNNKLCINFTSLETITFSDISILYSLWSKTFGNEQLKSQLNELKLPMALNEFKNKLTKIKIGTTEIDLYGHQIPLDIFIKSDIYEMNAYPSVEIVSVDTNERLVSIELKKAWEVEGGHHVAGYIEGDGIPPKGRLFAPFLWVSRIHFTPRDQDVATGDRPLLRLTTQLLIEIAELEQVNRVMIESAYDHSDVYASAGFYSKEYDPENPYIGMESIRKKVMKCREKKNKLYPESHDNMGFTVYLDKGEFSERNQTKYTRATKDGIEPAFVEFWLDGSKKTWEEQIVQHPILKPGTEPVLWRFWRKDISKLARKQ